MRRDAMSYLGDPAYTRRLGNLRAAGVLYLPLLVFLLLALSQLSQSVRG